MSFNTPLPPENTNPWYAPLVAVWAALTAFVNGLEASIDSLITGKANTVHTHAAGDVTSGTFVVARIPDLSMEKVTGLTAALGDKADLVDGFIPTSQLPPIALTEFLGNVANEAAMLALEGERGDWALRSDIPALAILTNEPSSSLANWQLVELPEAGVQSINGQSGLVILGYSDVGAASAAQGALAATALQPGDVAAVALSGAYGDLTGRPTLGTAAAQNSTAFATAAQGAKADTAVQPAGVSALVLSALTALPGYDAGDRQVLGHLPDGSWSWVASNPVRMVGAGALPLPGEPDVLYAKDQA